MGSHLLLDFDDLVRCIAVLLDSSPETEFLEYVKQQQILNSKNGEITKELKRLKFALDSANQEISKREMKLTTARRMIETEKQARRRMELERDTYMRHLNEVKRVVLEDPRPRTPEETRELLKLLQKNFNNAAARPHELANLSNMVGDSDSMSFDYSYSLSDADLLDEPTMNGAGRAKRNFSFADDAYDTVKRKKSTTATPAPASPPVVQLTPTAPPAESLESSPTDDERGGPSSCVPNKVQTPVIEQIIARSHHFTPLSSILPFVAKSCVYCAKKGRTMFKCEYCHATAHPECYKKIIYPCIPLGTPRKGTANSIADYAPLTPPMIPAFVILCINEVERRGLTEIGIYKLPGSEAGVRSLKDKLLKGKGFVNLSDESLHDVCSFLKEFLRDLPDTLIPQSEWNTFRDAIVDPNKRMKLYKAISSLPQANRDTLAYLILHLQHVSGSVACKMPISDIAKVFGPVVVGYSNNQQLDASSETKITKNIMEELLSLSSDYWSSFISVPTTVAAPKTPLLSKTPSTESLSKRTPYGLLFTPGGRRKFFNTPPNPK